MIAARAALAAAVLTTLAGCASQKGVTPGSTPEDNPPLATQPTSPEPFDTADADASRPRVILPSPAEDLSPQAISAMTTAYAKQLEQLATARAKDANAPAPIPSAATWGDPVGLALDPHSVLPVRRESVRSSETTGVGQASRSVETPPHPPATRPTEPLRANEPIELPAEDDEPNAQIASEVTRAGLAPEVRAKPKSDPAAAIDASVRRHATEAPHDLAAQLDLQLLMFLRDEPVPSLPDMGTVPTEDRELMTALMDGLVNFRNGVRADGNLLLGRKIRPLLDMADRMRARSDLSIPIVSLCTDVKGFAQFTPVESARFIAGAERPFILYCEVENFSSQLNDRKRWDTNLTVEAKLYTQGGDLAVWGSGVRPSTDEARTRRRDLYIADLQALPGTLAVGRYLLKVTVTDTQSDRVAEANLPVLVVAGELSGPAGATTRR